MLGFELQSLYTAVFLSTELWVMFIQRPLYRKQKVQVILKQHRLWSTCELYILHSIIYQIILLPSKFSNLPEKRIDRTFIIIFFTNFIIWNCMKENQTKQSHLIIHLFILFFSTLQLFINNCGKQAYLSPLHFFYSCMEVVAHGVSYSDSFHQKLHKINK